MRSGYALDHALGMSYYITDTPGIGGWLRRSVEDFVVEELPVEKGQEENGEYTYFTLEKRNWDTIKAISALSKALGVSKKRFSFAGTKDKRAVTRQRMSVWRVEPERLSQVKVEGLELSEFARCGEPLSVGELMGNRFTIRVRDVELMDEEVIRRCLEEMEEKGVPNYFGYQRFGVIRPNTHVVGKKLLKGDVSGAVMSYLAEPYEAEPEDARTAREELRDTGDLKKALRSFPNRLSHERTLLDHLYKNPGDFAGAFRKLHKKLRQMFIHGYQSYLFNLVLSRMIERGMEVKGREIPLFGFKSRFSPGEQGEIEREVLEEEGVALEEFRTPCLPELSSRGSRRKACLSTEVRYEMSGEDRSITFSFTLPKGHYATMVMRELMKTDPLRY